MNRRSFFAALAAPLLAPMRKLLPAAPTHSVIQRPIIVGKLAGGPVLRFDLRGLSSLDRLDGGTYIIYSDASKLTVSVGKDASA